MHTTSHGYTPARRPRPLLTAAMIGLGVAAATGTFFLGRATVDTPPAPERGTGEAVRNGIPVPNRRSEAGAATAAMTYQIAGSRVSTATLDAAGAAEVLLSPQATESARDVLAPVPPSGQGKATYAPLSAEVRDYTPSEAVVGVWGVSASSLLTPGQPEGTELWGRAVITVVWDGAQWRVIDHTYSDGPWPVAADARLAESEGDFSFRANEQPQGWAYVPDE